MMDNKNTLSLMLSLSHIKEMNKLIKIFCDKMSRIFINCKFYFTPDLPENKYFIEIISPGDESYGYIVCEGEKADEFREEVKNAVQLLAVMLERIDYEQKLKEEADTHKRTAENKQSEILKYIADLEQARDASLNLIQDLQIEINERKLAEEKIRKLSRIFEDSLNEIYLFDTETLKFVIANKAAQKNLGYSMDELKELTPIDIKPEFTFKTFSDLLFSLRNGMRDELVFETVHQRKDQSLYDVEVHVQLFRYEDEELFAAMILDISERKKAEELLSYERNKFSFILNSLPIGITVLDANDKYIYINPISLKIDGYPESAADLIGKNVRENHPKNSRLNLEKLLADFKSGKKTSHFREATRGERFVKISYHVLYDAQGKYNGLIRLVSDITEKKKSELLLKKSEKKYRDLFEKSDDAILIIENNKFVDCNNATVKMLRYESKEKLLNTHPSELSPPFQPDGKPSFEKAEEMMNIAVEKGSHRFEWDHKKADGEIFPVEVLLTHISTGDDTYLLHTVWRDITKRKKAETDLKESRQRLKSHLDNTPLGSIFWDVNCRVTDWNKSAERIFGFTKKEALGKHANDLIIPEEIQGKIDKLFKQLLSQNGGERSTNENITKSGKRILCNWYNVTIVDLSGKVTGVASLVDDITERRKTMEALKESNEFNKSLIDTIPFGIDIVDMEGNILFMNDLLKEAVGIEEIKGKCWEIYKDDIDQCIDCPLKQELEMGMTNVCEVHSVMGGREYEITHKVMKFKNQKALLEIFRDITEPKKAQEELIKAKEKAEEINRIKSSFFANMSHELRTPFVGIMGYAEILKDLLNDPQAVKLAQGILDSSNRLRNTLTEILDFSKIESEKITVNMEINEIRRIIFDCANLFSKSVEAKNLELNVDIQFDKLEMRIDEKLFRDILNNLISNAVKYTVHGWIDINAYKDSIDGEDYLIVKIKDTGIGISKNKKDVIWDEFRQASEGYNRNFEGTGLGLSITKHYVHLLCGKIFVESEVNKGTVFTVELPITSAGSSGSKDDTQNMDTDSIKKNKKNNAHKKLLYVEDDNFALFFVSKILSKYYDIETTIDGKTGLEMAKENKYDALLLDINLGEGLDGAELMEAIRRDPNYKTTPIIAVTAYAEDKDRIEFISRGFTKVLTKPFTKHELLESVNAVFKEKD